MAAIEQVVSLGCFCHTANHFQRKGIRTCSHPFDWILSSPEMVLACLRDDFATFLNPQYHERLGDDISNHTLYGTMVLGNNFQGERPQNIMFTHRDVTQPENRAYYERCVERFRGVLRSSLPTLFVLTAQDVAFDATVIQELHDELSSRIASFHLLCVSYYNDYHFRQESWTDPTRPRIRYMNVYTYSRTDGRGFAIETENDLFHDALQKHYVFPCTRKNVS